VTSHDGWQCIVWIHGPKFRVCSQVWETFQTHRHNYFQNDLKKKFESINKVVAWTLYLITNTPKVKIVKFRWKKNWIARKQCQGLFKKGSSLCFSKMDNLSLKLLLGFVRLGQDWLHKSLEVQHGFKKLVHMFNTQFFWETCPFSMRIICSK